MLPHPEKIQAIIFDWGGVCSTPAEPFALPLFQERVGMNVDDIAAHLGEIYWDYYRGKYTKETFWPLVLGHFGLHEDKEVNVESLNTAYVNSYRIFPQTLEIAAQLKKKGYKVSLLSNLTPDMRDHIRRGHDVARYFTPEIYSCDSDVGILKPDPAIYMLTAAKSGAEAAHCLFVDDSRKNTEAANAAGMQSILFESPEQFLSAITPLL
jgi:epoxide hydrolase-like predicted phosphatase